MNYFSLEIVRYRLEYIDEQPKIIIEMVKALDENGKYIKFVKLSEILPELHKYPIKFKKIE